jgi:poly(A) polymerase
VLYRLHQAGYGAFLVGGCVRDLLLGRKPKDFDIATDALPDEVRRLFKNCRLIGKRFRLAHILFGRDVIEVATFRTHHQNATHEQHAHSIKGMIVRDNVYGSIEDDACRRDFTVNALYYNVADFSVRDYTQGMDDIKNRVLRMIGDPDQRYHEDPVRLLRVVRFAGKLNLTISPETEEPLARLSYLLNNVSSARLFQEVLKFFQEGATSATVTLLQKYKLFGQLFPPTAHSIEHIETKKLLEVALENTDQRVQEGKTVSPAFLFAVFLWRPIFQHALNLEAEGLPIYVAVEKAIHHVSQLQTERLAIPRTLLVTVREICVMQHRFTQRYGTRPFRTLDHPRYRAGYDLLMLRAQAGEPVQHLYDWWTTFAEADPEQREAMVRESSKLSHKGKPKKKRRKKSNSRNRSAEKPIEHTPRE